MHLIRRFTERHLGRIEAFSDGIFAVAVTLPVLDLKMPALHDRADPLEGGEDVRGAVDWSARCAIWSGRLRPTSRPLCHLSGGFVIYALSPIFHFTPPQGPAAPRTSDAWEHRRTSSGLVGGLLFFLAIEADAVGVFGKAQPRLRHGGPQRPVAIVRCRFGATQTILGVAAIVVSGTHVTIP